MHLENVKAMRVQEGQQLENDLQEQLNKLEKIVENVKTICSFRCEFI